MRAVDTLVNRTREGTAALRGLSPTAPLAWKIHEELAGADQTVEIV
jgi:hypothetical protein